MVHPVMWPLNSARSSAGIQYSSMSRPADLVHVVAVEIRPFDVEPRHISDAAGGHVQLAGDLRGIPAVQHRVEDRLFGQARRPGAPPGLGHQIKLGLPGGAPKGDGGFDPRKRNRLQPPGMGRSRNAERHSPRPWQLATTQGGTRDPRSRKTSSVMRRASGGAERHTNAGRASARPWPSDAFRTPAGAGGTAPMVRVPRSGAGTRESARVRGHALVEGLSSAHARARRGVRHPCS